MLTRALTRARGGWGVSQQQVVWGVKGIKRSDNRDPFLEDFGEPLYDETFDLASVGTQLAIDAACIWASTVGKDNNDVTVRPRRCLKPTKEKKTCKGVAVRPCGSTRTFDVRKESVGESNPLESDKMV